MSAEAFFAYARERQSILLRRRAGGPPPWTDDPVLRKYRFCNVFREDDRTTIWFRENVRDLLFSNSSALLATVVYRWFNRIETGKILAHSRNNLLFEWNSNVAKKELAGLKPVVTGAYIIKTPDGMNKLDGVCWCIDEFIRKKGGRVGLRRAAEYFMNRQHTQQQMHEWLAKAAYLGPFMAYEVVTDLCHTAFLDKAPDRMTWTNFGPGAARGAGRVRGNDPEVYDRHRDQDVILMDAVHLLELSRQEQFWPAAWPQWEMRDVEHTLCEFDKYERARLGQGAPKQIFRGGRS